MAPYLYSLIDITGIDILAYRLRDPWPLVVTGKRFNGSVSVSMAALPWIIMVDFY
jgi:hypothetical protein